MLLAITREQHRRFRNQRPRYELSVLEPGRYHCPARDQAKLVAESKEAPDPHALGMTEAVFDYCAKADPKGAAKVRARLKRLVQGASRETLAKVRKSDEYRKARSSVEDFVAKVDERNASRVCSGPLAASK